ncbi:MAG: lytic murein transglycosylase [Helicobacteraceae bacterium CG2_30_36_10]|nr:MAG: lytic murein transglycosylase [Helicobacteraceae bacterium CG2_30_36_10]
MIKILFVLSLLLACANAEITIGEIKSKPTSRAKNFLIWQYLQQNITPQQADEAFNELDGVSEKFFFAYANKSDKKEIKETVSCMKENNLLLIKDKDCLALAISPYKTLNMTKKQREDLSKKIDSISMREILRIQSEPYTQKAYESYSVNAILTMFTSTTACHRRDNLNIYLDEQFLNNLATHPKISSFIKIVVNDNKLDKLQTSLLNLEGKQLNSESNFWLALNQLNHLNKKSALKHLELSLSKSTHRIDSDKNYFWMYQVTNDEQYLKKLLLSMDINIYTLFAHEIMKESFDNYFSSVETTENKAKRNIQDPFYWDEIRDEIRVTPKSGLINLASAYKNKNMSPVQAMILEKAYNYKIHSYIMPYDDYLKDISSDEKALIYAIMKQESHLIPSALSHSYALGLMQIMPFLVDALGKEEEKPLKRYEEMFNPKTNINYALKHLQWMKKSLYHPLFMAYAYNGGMGFLKRYLLKDNFNNGPYEPFISMELMANSESREYGKKVLANYVMYKKVMGEDISIVHLFDTLTQPKKTDRFREQG